MQKRFHSLTAMTLLAVMAVVLCFSHEARAQSAEAHQQFLFGYKLLQRGEDKLAADALDKYLIEYPQDDKRGDALYYRALIAQRTGNNTAAAKFLANPPQPKHVPAYAIDLLRGQVHSDLGQFDHALAALERIDVKEVDDLKIKASVYQLIGRAHKALGNLGGAVTSLCKASDLDTPLRSRSLLDLARVHIIRGEQEKALAVLDECLATNDVDQAPEAAQLAGDQCYKLEQYDKAEQYYRSVLEKYENSSHYGSAAVGVMWSQFSRGQYKPLLETSAKYGDSVDKANKVTAAYLAGSAQQALEQHKEANATFNAIANSSRGTKLHEQILYKKALSEFELGQYETMNQSLRQLFAEYPQSKLNMDGQFLIAAADAKLNDFAQGIERLGAIINHDPKHPFHDQALLQRADLFRRNNQFDKAVDDYMRFYALPGKINAIGQFVDHRPVMRLLDLQYRLERFEAVEKTATSLLASAPQPDITEEAMYRLALARVKLGEHLKAIQTFDTLLDKYPTSQYVSHWQYYRGLLRISGKDRDNGLKDLSLAADSDKLEQRLRTNALRMMAMAYREAGNTELTAQTLARLKEFSGLTADEMYWLAKRFAAQGKPAEALEFLGPLLDETRKIPAKIRGDAQFLAGMCLHDTGQYDQAVASYQKLIDDRHAYSTQAKLHKAKALRMAGKVDEALAVYEKLTTVSTSSVAANAHYDAAHIYLEKAEQAKRADDLEALAAHRASAAEKFRKLIVLFPFADLSPIPESSFVELAQLLESSGQSDKAKETLSELVEKFPHSPFATYAGALLDLYAQKRGDARAKLDQLFKQRELLPDNLNHMVDFQLKALEGTG